MNKPPLITIADDRPTRWAQISALAAEWGRPIKEGWGVERDRLARAEQRLGFALPAALKEWYEMAGVRPSAADRWIHLLAPEELALEADTDMLLIAKAEQGSAYWSIRSTDLTNDDPPVVGEDGFSDHLVQVSGSLSAFLFALTIDEAMFFSEYGSGDPVSPRVAELVVQYFPQVALEHYWPAHPTSIFMGPDTIITLDAEYFLYAGARTAEACARLRDLFGIYCDRSM